MTVAELAKKLNNFVGNLDNIIANVVNFNEELENLNKKQLSEGKLSTGAAISPLYSRRYAIWKAHFYPHNYKAGIVNLKLTGEFYKNLEIKGDSKSYEILSLTPYSAKLVSKYGNAIFNIAPENQPKAKQITTKLISQELQKALR